MRRDPRPTVPPVLRAQPSGDLAVALLRRGYDALPALWAPRPDSNATWSRLLGAPALVVRGPEGAELFHDTDVVRRRDAVPPPLAPLLFGPWAVHALDDEERRTRRALLVDHLDAAAVGRLGDLVDSTVREEVAGWRSATRVGRSVGVLDSLAGAYARAALTWVGLEDDAVRPVPSQRRRMVADLVSMVDGLGSGPAAYARSRGSRVRAQRWAARAVETARDRPPRVAGEAGFLDVLAHGAGRDLPVVVAATELLDVVRATTAVARLGTSAAYRLLLHPDLGPDLARDDEVGRRSRTWFAHEMRRTTPFVPALAARVRRDGHWDGQALVEGDRVVLDVPGTLAHASWGDPEVFRPDRFAEAAPDPFRMVPQGGGPLETGHRCPGESATLTLLDRTVRVLAGTPWTGSTTAPDRRRVPTLPGGGLRVVDVGAPPSGHGPSGRG